MRNIYLIFIFALIAVSCSKEEVQNPPVLVVEGWIDYMRSPVVKLSWSLPITNEKILVEDLGDYIEKWAKVTIDNGDQEIGLIATRSSDNFPPYIYTTARIKGEIGKTYTLKVECPNGIYAEAQTTILPPTDIKSFQVKEVATSDTLRELYAFIDMNDNDTPKYYKSYVNKQGKNMGYMSSYMGLASSEDLAADGKVPIYNGRTNLQKNFTTYFSVGDTISLKLARLTEEGYNFWRAYEDLTSLSNTPLFPVQKNLPTNIKGGIGYWMGMGSSFYRLRIEENGVTILGNK